ncbi:hypothetical protein [Neptunitalea lumnitzerae]|uniref:Uncharacterized protein n=1 Tax=Neptunitalea lumnitzerae TaxID=2965509 RepID=A0ABQ5MMF1_9FLAO|nr:hypothetical protein [Neptunitalea sp. Y10]GLB50579.1 hypothetical protein Y10_29470 [Neptunitalea sp. Y10]
MKKLILLISAICLFSCGKQKTIELPETLSSDTTEMEDYSPAYLFYNTENKDSIELNRKNLIITTNWVLHIDKRLKLYQAIPTIKILQAKKADAKMHKNEDAKNYLTVNDKTIENLGFIDFTETEFVYDTAFSKFYIDDNPEKFTETFPLTVNFKQNNGVTLNQTETTKEELVDFIKEFSAASAMGRAPLIYLNFDKHVTYQDYITDLQLVKKAIGDSIKLSPIQFIYDETKLPDCGCTL